MVHQVFSWFTFLSSKKLIPGSSPYHLETSCNISNYFYVNNNYNCTKKCNTLSGYYQNVRGLKTKLSIFRQNFVTLNHYDYFILTETWLTTEISSSELGMSDYLIYRNDRNNINSIYSKGGGVLIAMHKRFNSHILSLPNLTLETLAISITTLDSKMLFLALYIPPNSTVEVYTSHCLLIENLRSSFPDYIFIIVGDFNLPDINWPNIYHYNVLHGPASLKAKVLTETIDYEHLYQHNLIPNYKNNILDLVLSNNCNLIVTKCPVSLVPFDLAHPVLQIEGPSYVPPLKTNPKSIKHNFSRANYLSMNTYFNTINWDSLLDDSLEFPAMVTNFYSTITYVINLFTPKFYNHKSSYPPWYSKELKNLIFNKKTST